MKKPFGLPKKITTQIKLQVRTPHGYTLTLCKPGVADASSAKEYVKTRRDHTP